jgi:flagellin
MSVINTNVSSLIAQNAITSNSLSQSKAMQQLSTGLRINGAKDDAAGLAIASKMTSQIKGLDQAVRNSNDAISMLQTTDGALVAVGDMMQRMRELSVQGASDTNVASDRTALQAEFSQLSNEVSRIAKSTQWNGMNILDGSANGGTGTFNFQVGSSAGQTVPKTIVNMGAVASTTGTAAIVTTAATSTAGQIGRASCRERV